MTRVAKDSVETRIYELLKKKYPITVKDIQQELKINPKIIDLALARLAKRYIIELEPLPDKTFVRLLVFEY